MSLRWVEGLVVFVALMSLIFMANLRACSKRKLVYVELAVQCLGSRQKLLSTLLTVSSRLVFSSLQVVLNL